MDDQESGNEKCEPLHMPASLLDCAVRHGTGFVENIPGIGARTPHHGHQPAPRLWSNSRPACVLVGTSPAMKHRCLEIQDFLYFEGPRSTLIT